MPDCFDSQTKKWTCWNAFLSCTHISYEALGKKIYSVVSCVVCFFQKRENMFCCDVTKNAIFKPWTKLDSNIFCRFIARRQFFAPIIATLRKHFECSTPNISLNISKQLVFVMFEDSVLCEGETEYLHTYISRMHDRLLKYDICKIVNNLSEGTQQHRWLTNYTTSRMMTDSIADGVIGISHSLNPPAALWPWGRFRL
jgi:hypothetical protein